MFSFLWSLLFLIYVFVLVNLHTLIINVIYCLFRFKRHNLYTLNFSINCRLLVQKKIVYYFSKILLNRSLSLGLTRKSDSIGFVCCNVFHVHRLQVNNLVINFEFKCNFSHVDVVFSSFKSEVCRILMISFC